MIVWHLASNKSTPNTKISTYNDHRMAMAFAPLALKNNSNWKFEVVSKSYPDFWEDLKFLDFSITELKA
jgi:3-phosphoshikimate 1-carboxyvinyltransferase